MYLAWMNDSTQSQTRWSVRELMIALDAYLARLHGDDTRPARETVKETAQAIRRTKGSIEYRWQNFSAILEERGEEWLQGYVPRANVGNKVRRVVNDLLDGVVIEDDALPSTAIDRRVSTWVYLVEHPVRRIYKIGITVDPDKRVGDHIDNGYVERARWFIGAAARSVEQRVLGKWRSAGLSVGGAAPADGRTETVATLDMPLSDVYEQVARAIAEVEGS